MRVEILLGQLERTVAIWINSTDISTATPNQGELCVCMCVCVCVCVWIACKICDLSVVTFPN